MRYWTWVRLFWNLGRLHDFHTTCVWDETAKSVYWRCNRNAIVLGEPMQRLHGMKTFFAEYNDDWCTGGNGAASRLHWILKQQGRWGLRMGSRSSTRRDLMVSFSLDTTTSTISTHLDVFLQTKQLVEMMWICLHRCQRHVPGSSRRSVTRVNSPIITYVPLQVTSSWCNVIINHVLLDNFDDGKRYILNIANLSDRWELRNFPQRILVRQLLVMITPRWCLWRVRTRFYVRHVMKEGHVIVFTA